MRKPHCYQVVADVRFSNVDKSSNIYKSSNGAYQNLAMALEPQNIGLKLFNTIETDAWIFFATWKWGNVI